MQVTAFDRLKSLSVGDAMSHSPLLLYRSDTMQRAAEEFQRRNLSGAPVVDERGKLTGILSRSDFLPLAGGGESRPGLVNDFMSCPVISVTPQATLLCAARVLCDAHVHRLVVVDRSDCPVGVLSSTDIIAAMVNAVDEQASQGHPIDWSGILLEHWERARRTQERSSTHSW